MNLLHRLEHWGDTHHPRWIDIVRVALGIFLFIKGINFLSSMSLELDRVATKTSFSPFLLLILGHFIIFTHMLGGFLLAIGLATRLACIAQIPILMGAVVFNTSEGLWTPYSELSVSIIVLLLLVYFLIAGNGRWSFEQMVKES